MQLSNNKTNHRPKELILALDLSSSPIIMLSGRLSPELICNYGSSESPL
jgi:hypothetical protein